MAIPDGDTVDVSDAARGSDGTLVACGDVYDHSGRGSGFLALFSPAGDKLAVVRLSPYSPSRITVASDGTIWTAGLEVTNARDSTPPGSGVIRHFDRDGKILGSFIPRSTFSSPFMVQYGALRSARGRIGWYTGPIRGPGSRFYEILSDGTMRSYPLISLESKETVTGLGLTDDGRTYVTTRNIEKGTWGLLSIGGPDQSWTKESPPIQLGRVWLYGAEGGRLVLHHRDRFTVAFVNVSSN
jgi:hypothetical protein